MNNKKIVAGLMALTLVFGGTALPNTVVSSVASVITAQAYVFEADCYSFDLDTGVLTLRGEVNGDELRTFSNRMIVSSVVAEEGTVLPEDCSYLFGEYINCTSIDLSNADTSNVTNMSRMFSLCYSLTSLDVSGFDTSNVTNMSRMFEDCAYLTSLDVSGFDTSNVTDMSGMFSHCYSLTSLDVSGFNTSNVTDMSGMFEDCADLTSLDVSGFDTSNVTDMSRMFEYCKNLTALDVRGFDTSNVTDMSGMFSFCNDLTTLDVSGFDTSNVTDMSRMFLDCHLLTTLDVSGFDTSNVTSMYGVFLGCKSLTTLDLSGFDTSNVEDMFGMFKDCVNLTTLDLSSFDTSKVKEREWDNSGMNKMFRGCENLKKITLGENFKYINIGAELPNGDGWVNVNDPSTIVSSEEFHYFFAVIENDGNNTYVRYFRNTPTNIKADHSEQYHQIRFTWDKVENAEQYGIAVYLAGKWRVQAQDITDTAYTTPKNLTPGKTYKVAIAAKVDGKWFTSSAIENAITVTVK